MKLECRPSELTQMHDVAYSVFFLLNLMCRWNLFGDELVMIKVFHEYSFFSTYVDCSAHIACSGPLMLSSKVDEVRMFW
jgi:hypothetical protein